MVAWGNKTGGEQGEGGEGGKEEGKMRKRERAVRKVSSEKQIRRGGGERRGGKKESLPIRGPGPSEVVVRRRGGRSEFN